MAEFLFENLIEQVGEVEVGFPNEELALIDAEKWLMSFDRAVNKSGAGIGVVLMAPNRERLLISKRLCFPVTNNVAKYEACICGLEALIGVEAKEVDVTRDSLLVIS